MTTIAQHLVRVLAANDVRRVYGVPGDSLNGVTDAIRTEDSIDWVLTRHEEAAAFAAAGEAAATGSLAVCAGSCGPGNLHLINGLHDAQRSRVPVLAIAAHIPSAEIGSNYFQETRPSALFRDCSVFCEEVQTAEQMPRLLELAMRAAIEQRGVAVLVISGDLALTEAADERVTVVRRTASAVLPSPAELDRAAELLNGAKRVTILAGAGVEGAHDEVVALADRLAAPIVHALRGKEHIEWDNPFDVGMSGLLGYASGYKALKEADAVLLLGTDFPYQQFFPEDAIAVQVDVRGEQLGRRVPLDAALRGTVRETSTALQARIRPGRRRKHLESSVEHYRRTRERFDALERQERSAGPVHPQFLTRMIDELAADDAVFLPDVGTPVVWACRHLGMNGRRRLLGSFSHGTMAAALPLGIGVQAAHPDRQVVVLAGDGGLAMTLGELLTVAQHRLPVKVIVFDNAALGFVEVEMKAAGFVNEGTELRNPDFAALAASTGMLGLRAERADEVRPAVTQLLAHDGPGLLQVSVARQELSLPPAVTAEQAKGFTLYALRTVLSGRGDELVDLAKTNLRQVL